MVFWYVEEKLKKLILTVGKLLLSGQLLIDFSHRYKYFICEIVCLNHVDARLHGIVVSNSEKHFYHHCDKTLQKVGLTDVSSKDLVNIVDGYKGKGYGQSTEEELGMAFISTVFIRLNTKVRGWLWAAVDTYLCYLYLFYF